MRGGAASEVGAGDTVRETQVVLDPRGSARLAAQHLRVEHQHHVLLLQGDVGAGKTVNLISGPKEFDALVQSLVSADIGVVYYAGSYVEGGTIARALRAAGSSAQIVSGDSLVTEDYLNQAKDAAEGTLMTYGPDPRNRPEAKDVVAKVVGHAHPVVLIAVVVKPMRAFDVCGVSVLWFAP